MIYFELLYNFMIVGIFSIGGGYSAIPLVRDVAKDLIGLSDEMISNFIAISESTPGPVLVNLATFIGNEKAGLMGAIVATIATILPAFVIILILAVFFTKLIKIKKVKRTLSFVRPCVFGIMMAVGLFMLYKNISNALDIIVLKGIILAVALIVIMALYRKITKQKLQAIPTIIIGALFGIVINMIL